MKDLTPILRYGFAIVTFPVLVAMASSRQLRLCLLTPRYCAFASEESRRHRSITISVYFMAVRWCCF